MKRVTIIIEGDDGKTATLTTFGAIRADKTKIERVSSAGVSDLRSFTAFDRPEPFRVSMEFVAHPDDTGKCLEVVVTPGREGS